MFAKEIRDGDLVIKYNRSEAAKSVAKGGKKSAKIPVRKVKPMTMETVGRMRRLAKTEIKEICPK